MLTPAGFGRRLCRLRHNLQTTADADIISHITTTKYNTIVNSVVSVSVAFIFILGYLLEEEGSPISHHNMHERDA